jgi:uncharacterized protein YndB with AHSA1/START domain
MSASASPVAAQGAGAKPSLTIKRRLNAPAEKVYAAWTDPEKLKRWFGPDTGAVSSAQTEVRFGGRFHIVFRTEDGEEHDVSGIYREVVPNSRLQFSWAWKSTPERESLVTITVKPDGDGSILTLLHEQFYDEAARDRHAWGWNGSLDKLERYIA